MGIALTVCVSNHAEVRDRMSKLVGNQSRYRRLDAEGCLRARAVQALQKKVIARPSCDDEYQRLQAALARQIDTHNLACKLHSIALIRTDIRALLRDGARRK